MTSALAWSWRNALHGVVLAVPAGIAAALDPATGLALAVGILPAMALGVSSTRRQRIGGLLVGGIAGASILLGSVVGRIPALAVLAILVLCIGAAALSAGRSRKLVGLVLTLGIPLVGAGLSFDSIGSGLAAAGLILCGSAYGFVVSLPWPDRPGGGRPGGDRPGGGRPAARGVTRAAMVVYGVQIGVAGALAAAVGFALGVDHPGWACTAALMVSRPDHAALIARGWGRAVSVIAGAVLACGVAALDPAAAIAATVLLGILVLGTGTAGSRWYVFPFFSTYVVLSLLLLGESESPAHWFVERVGMTLLGVALAVVAAVVVPRVARPLIARR